MNPWEEYKKKKASGSSSEGKGESESSSPWERYKRDNQVTEISFPEAKPITTPVLRTPSAQNQEQKMGLPNRVQWSGSGFVQEPAVASVNIVDGGAALRQMQKSQREDPHIQAAFSAREEKQNYLKETLPAADATSFAEVLDPIVRPVSAANQKENPFAVPVQNMAGVALGYTGSYATAKGLINEMEQFRHGETMTPEEITDYGDRVDQLIRDAQYSLSWLEANRNRIAKEEYDSYQQYYTWQLQAAGSLKNTVNWYRDGNSAEVLASHEDLRDSFYSGTAPVDEINMGIAELEDQIALYDEKIDEMSRYLAGTNLDDATGARWQQAIDALVEKRQEVAAQLAVEQNKDQYLWAMAFSAKENDANTDQVILEGKEVYQNEYTAWENQQNEIFLDIVVGYGGGNTGVNLAKEEAARRAREDHPTAVSVEHMTADEQDMFYYLIGAGYENMAIEYAQQTAIAARSAKLREYSNWAGKNFGTGVLATLGYASLMPFGGYDYLASEGEFAKTGLNASQTIGPGAIRDSLAGGVAAGLNHWSGTIPESVPVFGGKGVGDVYQMGLSMGDSYGSAMAFGPYATLFLGLNAASSAYNDAIMRGATVEDAQMIGGASGLAEALFEYISIGKFLDGKVTGQLVKDALIQGGIEASEEALTSISNEIVDRIVMQDKSNYAIAVEAYMEEGLSKAEAEARASQDFWYSVAWDSVAGFITGGVMGGGQSANVYNAVSDVMKLKDSQNFDDRVNYEIAKRSAGVLDQESSNEQQQKFAAWIVNGQKTSQETREAVERDFAASERNIRAAQVYEELGSEAAAAEKAGAILEGIVRGEVTAENISPNQVRDLMLDTKIGADAMSRFLGIEVKQAESNEVESAAKAALQNYARKVTDPKAAEVSAEETSAQEPQPAAQEVPGQMQEDAEYSAERKTVEAVFEMLLDFGVHKAAAQSLAEQYDPAEGVKPETYARGAAEAWHYGRAKFSEAEMLDKKGFSVDLSEKQRSFAYRIGQVFQRKQTAAREAEIRDMKKTAREGGKNATKGSVEFHKDIDRESLSQRQKVSVEALEKLAKALGAKFRLFQSEISKDVKPIGRNGWYDPKTGEIYIDIQAGEYGKGTILFTAAHELTHFIYQWSPAKFKILADFLVEQYGKKGQSVADLVRAQQEKAKRNGRKLGWSEAYHEMVADSMETMLSDGKVIEKLMELRARDKNLVQKIRAWFKAFAEKLRAAYRNMSPDTQEGRLVAEMADVADRLKELFTEGLAEAGENYRAIGAQKNTAEEGGLKLHSRDSGIGERTYSFAELTAKGSIAGKVIPSSKTVFLKSDGSIDRSKIADAVIKQCNSIQTRAPIPTYYVKVHDIDKNVQITKKDLNHAYLKFESKNGKSVPLNSLINARATLDLPNILQNSIEVNRAQRGDNSEVEFEHILLGVTGMEEADGNINYYAVRSVVQARKNQGAVLTEANILGKLHAANAKKIEKPHAQVVKNKTLTRSPLFSYNIADILEDVKNKFDDTFAKDVYQRLGMIRKETTFSTDLLYSDRGNVTSRDVLDQLDPAQISNEIRRKHVQEYQNVSRKLDQEQRNAAAAREELRQLRSGKGKRDMPRIRALEEDLRKANNRIDIQAGKLLRMEQGSILQRVLQQEQQKTIDRIRMEDKKAFEAYHAESRQSHAKEVQELREKHLAEKKRNSDTRKKAEMRTKIKKQIGKLRSLFANGTKEKNIKADLRGTAASVLASAELIFDSAYNYSNEAMVRNGVGTDLTDEESRKLNHYVDLLARQDALEAQMELYAASRSEEDLKRLETVEKQIARNKTALSELNRELRTVFERERRRLNEVTLSSVVGSIAEEYAKLKNSEYGYVQGAYDEGVYGRLMVLKDEVDGTIARDMSLTQLTALSDAITMVTTTISNAGKLFVKGKAEDLRSCAETVIEEIKEKKPKNKSSNVSRLDKFIYFAWENLKPVYAMRAIGSKQLEQLYWECVRAEGVYAKDIAEAGEFISKMRKKCGFTKWDRAARTDFDMGDGRVFSLNVEQMMSIYAYSRREQALKHMLEGGFEFDGNETFRKGKFGPKRSHSQSETYRVDLALLMKISGTLTEQQRQYAEAMQDYLSQMGEKGNEASRMMYGIDLFTEKHYFPLKSSKNFIRSEDVDKQKAETTASLKNSGMTKETVVNANNPIVLSSFDDVWLSHVIQMANYHAFVVPIDNLNKVFNYTDRSGTENVSLREVLNGAYGTAATKYLEQYIKDLNSGISSSDGYNHIFMNLFGKAKMAATAASLSTAIQQPTAILRAMAYVRPDYFLPVIHGKNSKTVGISELYGEMKKYAPIAIIKEMGGFDVGSNSQAKDYIGVAEYRGTDKLRGFLKDGEYRKSAMNNAFGALATWGDELGWTAIWCAVKREVAAKQKQYAPGSEAYLNACGERFTEVIALTQVYDSVNSRSGLMRSKGDLNKFATSFAGEPTTSLNMLVDAVMQLRRGGSKMQAAKSVVAVFASTVAAAAAAAVIYAMRDDDDDKPWGEKWAEEFGKKLAGELGVIEIKGRRIPTFIGSMVPYVRDMISVLNGSDVERQDMSLISDFVASYKKLSREDVPTYRKVEEFAGAIAAFFGVPLRNIMRDARGIFNAYSAATDDLEGGSLWDAFKRGFAGKTESAAEQLYTAMVDDDSARAAALKENYADDYAFTNAVRGALRENDSRIEEAAIAHANGDVAEYIRIVEEILAEGHFDEQDILAAIRAEENGLDQEETGSSEHKYVKRFDAADYLNAILSGDRKTAAAVKDDLINEYLNSGKDAQEAQKAFVSGVRSDIGDRFKTGELSYDAAMDYLVRYGDLSEEDAYWKLDEWSYTVQHGSDEGYSKQYSTIAQLAGNAVADQISASITALSPEEGYTSVRPVQKWEAIVSADGLTGQQQGEVLKTYMTDSQVEALEICMDAGVSAADFVAIYRAKETVGDQNGSWTQDELRAYLDNSKFTRVQKAAIWEAFGKNWKTNPYK